MHAWAQVFIPKDTETQWGQGLAPSPPFTRPYGDSTEKAIFPPSKLHFLGTFGPSVGVVTAWLCSMPPRCHRPQQQCQALAQPGLGVWVVAAATSMRWVPGRCCGAPVLPSSAPQGGTRGR